MSWCIQTLYYPCFLISTAFPEAFLLNSIPVLCDQILAYRYKHDNKGQGTPFILWTAVVVLEALDTEK